LTIDGTICLGANQNPSFNLNYLQKLIDSETKKKCSCGFVIYIFARSSSRLIMTYNLAIVRKIPTKY